MSAPRMCDMDVVRSVSCYSPHTEIKAAYFFISWYMGIEDMPFEPARLHLRSIACGTEYKEIYARYLVEKSL